MALTRPSQPPLSSRSHDGHHAQVSQDLAQVGVLLVLREPWNVRAVIIVSTTVTAASSVIVTTVARSAEGGRSEKNESEEDGREEGCRELHDCGLFVTRSELRSSDRVVELFIHAQAETTAVGDATYPCAECPCAYTAQSLEGKAKSTQQECTDRAVWRRVDYCW